MYEDGVEPEICSNVDVVQPPQSDCDSKLVLECTTIPVSSVLTASATRRDAGTSTVSARTSASASAEPPIRSRCVDDRAAWPFSLATVLYRG